jgi:hypothetical protein
MQEARFQIFDGAEAEKGCYRRPPCGTVEIQWRPIRLESYANRA